MAEEITTPAPEANDIVPEPQPLAEPVLTSPQPFYKNKLIIAVAVILLVAIAGAAYFFYNQQVNKTPVAQKPGPTPTPGLASKLADKKPDFIIAKVGEENIYKKDLNIELAAYPKSVPADQAMQTILDKMINDSVTLQQGKKEGYISILDNSVYNSLSLDYPKRIKLVQTVQSAINNKNEKITGAIISIWFNNLKPGPLGYEQGKAFALEKITKYYQDVKSGRLTIQAAGEAIKKDSSLAKIDPTAYKVNAILNFKDYTRQQPLTFDNQFNQIVWNLKPGEISEIYLAKATPEGKTEKIDSLYAFAQVSKKTATGSTVDYLEWLKNAKKNYEITNY